ncbi:hypothetical protein AVEN_143304-1 [Araneus ventricosus]|uniref:Uncharacterized protein n=1 Tax=Araneus ventricosus TaxID=182803 RepID=A0A4Y2ADR0_ARAVE|nr:hypothetical protein AVEN_143304-1 [Araneus ventricosus]
MCSKTGRHVGPSVHISRRIIFEKTYRDELCLMYFISTNNKGECAPVCVQALRSRPLCLELRNLAQPYFGRYATKSGRKEDEAFVDIDEGKNQMRLEPEVKWWEKDVYSPALSSPWEGAFETVVMENTQKKLGVGIKNVEKRNYLYKIDLECL